MTSSKSLRKITKLIGRYIPDGATACETPPGLDCIAYIYTAARNGVVKWLGIGYGGKRTKPDWHYSFPNEAKAREYIGQWFVDRMAAAKSRADYQAGRKAEKCRTVADVLEKAKRNGSISAADTAICLRAALAAKFPGFKFSVTSENYSMGCAVRVHWTDGPIENDVEAIADDYSFAGFDGMIDLKYSVDRWLAPDGSMSLAHSEGTEGSRGVHGESIGDPHHPGAVLVTGGAHYVTTSRTISHAVKLELAAKVCAKYLIAMPESFATETDFERWLNTTRADVPAFQNGGVSYLNQMVWRESNESGVQS